MQLQARRSLFMNANGADSGRLRPPDRALVSHSPSCDNKDDSRWKDALLPGESFARVAEQLLTLLDEPEDHVVLFLSFHRDEVHAVLSANVPGVQPVYLLIGVSRHVSTVEIIVTPEVELLRPCKGIFLIICSSYSESLHEDMKAK